METPDSADASERPAAALSDVPPRLPATASSSVRKPDSPDDAYSDARGAGSTVAAQSSSMLGIAGPGPAVALAASEVAAMLPLVSSPDRTVALAAVKHVLAFVLYNHSRQARDRERDRDSRDDSTASLGPALTPQVCAPAVHALVTCLKRHRVDLETAEATLSSLWGVVRISPQHAKLLAQFSGVSPVVNTAREHMSERRIVTKAYRILRAVGRAAPANEQNPLVARKFHGVSLYRRLLNTLGERNFRNFSNLLLLIRSHLPSLAFPLRDSLVMCFLCLCRLWFSFIL